MEHPVFQFLLVATALLLRASKKSVPIDLPPIVIYICKQLWELLPAFSSSAWTVSGLSDFPHLENASSHLISYLWEAQPKWNPIKMWVYR